MKYFTNEEAKIWIRTGDLTFIERLRAHKRDLAEGGVAAAFTKIRRVGEMSLPAILTGRRSDAFARHELLEAARDGSATALLRRNDLGAVLAEPIPVHPIAWMSVELDGIWPDVLWDASEIMRRWPAEPRRRPYRPERKYWAKIARPAALEWLKDNGCPESGDGQQAVLERHVAKVLAEKNEHPSESTTRDHVRRWIAEYRQRLDDSPEQTSSEPGGD